MNQPQVLIPRHALPAPGAHEPGSECPGDVERQETPRLAIFR